MGVDPAGGNQQSTSLSRGKEFRESAVEADEQIPTDVQYKYKPFYHITAVNYLSVYPLPHSTWH